MHSSLVSIALRLWFLKRPKSAIHVFAVTLCGLAAAAVGAPQAAQPARESNELSLTRAEEAVIESPFAPRDSRALLLSSLAAIESAHVTKSLLPRISPDPPTPKTMGWRVPDEAYWRSIPEHARTIPKDWSRLACVRFTNSQLGGIREVRLAIGAEYDQWLLSDPRHNLSACISVHRRTHRVYFMEVAVSAAPGDAGKWVYHAAFDNCFSCHPSGLRAIRPLDEHGVDTTVLARFNRRILSYHACDYGDSVDPEVRGESIPATGCGECHNGVNRGKLYDINRKTIGFKTEKELTMPP